MGQNKLFKILKRIFGSCDTYWRIKGRAKYFKKKLSKGLRKAFKYKRVKIIGD